MEPWVVFRNKETREELCSYTVRGTFPGEAEATAGLLSEEHGLPRDQITATVENR